MKNIPYVKAFRGSKVDFLASFSNSTNVGVTGRPTHGCVDQMRSLKVFAHFPAWFRLLAFVPVCLYAYNSYWNFKHGTSAMIFPWAKVMFSICSSKNIGSALPSHTKVSILYGTKPLGQRAVGSVKKAPRACPVPRWASGTAMSPSTKLGLVCGGTKLPRKVEEIPPGVAKNHRRQIRDMLGCLSTLNQETCLGCGLVPRDCGVYVYTHHKTCSSFEGPQSTYGSVSAGREKWPFRITFFFNPIRCGGLETLSGAGGGGKRPPYRLKHLWYFLTEKWFPTSYLAETKMFQQKNNPKVVCNMYN